MADSRRVLVVDDERSIRSVLTEALVEEGCEVRSARDGREALGIARAWTPDAILLDLTMPVLDGRAFREALRASPDELADVPLIVLSGARNAEAQAAAMGAAIAMPKPFDLDAVLEAVERVLRQ